MKKVLFLLGFVLCLNAAFSQNKKDGTPDKRHKANKEKKVRLKKDGTPDKRFKANQ